MKVLVLNCGSSSLKYQLFEMENEEVLAKGQVERIGLDGSILTYQAVEKDKIKVTIEAPDHEKAIKEVIAALVSPEHGIIKSIDEVSAVGHRVVHGGEQFSGSVLITKEVKDAIEECIELAPLHNPPNLLGVTVCEKLLPGVPQVAVFDTAFHQTMPAHAYLYGLPYNYYQKFKVRRYGFHGTSHKYVAKRAAKMLNRPFNELKIVTCHLGNGSSVTAVDHGKSVDTSMGFTPLEGLVMGTRCGDIDPTIIQFIMNKEDKDVDQIMNILNKQSGVLGISGVSSDFRDVETEAWGGNERAKIALDIFSYKVKKDIGAYAAAMGGLDAVVFTAGLGENSPETREDVCRGLDFMGITLDPEKNGSRLKDGEGGREISTPESKVKVLVIATNEELMIARDTKEILEG